MRRASRRLESILRVLWRGVRQWSGDADYERYLRACRQQPDLPGNASALSPKQFYLEQLNRRYSRPNRCC